MTPNENADNALLDYARRLEENGFAIVPSVVDEATIDLLLDAIALVARAQSPDSVAGIYALRNLLEQHTLRAFAGSPAVRRLVVPLLGPKAFPVRGVFFDKTPDANWKVNWHQDLAIAVWERKDAAGFGAWSEKAGVIHAQPPPELLARMLTVRVHLDDCPPENGALRVLAGSHQGGRLRDGEIAEWRRQVAETICGVGRGSALVIRPLLLHASSASENAAHRRVIHLEYAAEALPDGLQWRYGASAIS